MEPITSREKEPVFFSMRKDAGRIYADLAGYWSYPAFIRGRNDTVLWLFVVLPVATDHSKKISFLFKPKGMLITMPESKICVRYENFITGKDPFKGQDPKKPVALFPHEGVKGITRQELHQKEKRLLAMYKENSKAFGKKVALEEDFRKLWTQLSHPVFSEYLRPLAKEFITAMEGPTKSQ